MVFNVLFQIYTKRGVEFSANYVNFDLSQLIYTMPARWLRIAASKNYVTFDVSQLIYTMPA